MDSVYTVRRGDDRSTYSEVIVEDVLMLAADTPPQRDEGSMYAGARLTFALKPEEVLKIELARNLGRISVARRSVNDPKASGANPLKQAK